MSKATTIFVALTFVAGLLMSSPAFSQTMYITVDRLNVRQCDVGIQPTKKCPVENRLHFRSSVEVRETIGDWARVSPVYADFDSGKQVARWVSKKFLSLQQPPHPGEGATGWEDVVKESDDFRLHRAAFAKAAEELVGKRACTKEQIRGNGGFWASISRGDGNYFIDCGRSYDNSRYYLNVKTGKITRK